MKGSCLELSNIRRYRLGYLMLMFHFACSLITLIIKINMSNVCCHALQADRFPYLTEVFPPSWVGLVHKRCQSLLRQCV